MNTRKLTWLLPCMLLAFPAMAEESNVIKMLQDQVESLKQHVKTLENKQWKMQDSFARKPSTATPLRAQAATTAENTGNPSISVIGTFLGSSMHSSNGVHKDVFFPLSEGEFVFGAAVDAHTRLDVTATAADGGVAVEEGYITSQLPYGWRMRSGRKFIPIGRANGVHPHALVYADTPNGLVNLFGAEKLVGEGVFIDYPMYIGDSVQSLLLGVFQNNNDVVFDPLGNEHFAGMAHWTGMWDIDDATTLELGGTYIQGRNGATDSSKTRITGGHFALKNAQFDRSGWSFQGEWARSQAEQGSALPQTVTDGAYLLGEYDFNRNWMIFSRYDDSRMSGGLGRETALSVGTVWKLSEFQSLTIQYKHTHHALTQTAANLGISTGQNANEALLRWVVAIGPHRPHSY